jgi:anthranilate phosphoribosyltransferase
MVNAEKTPRQDKEGRVASMADPCAWLETTLEALRAGRHTSSDDMIRLVEGLLAGAFSPEQTAALLVALRDKGETAEELASAAAVLRRHCQPLEAGPDVLDTCGTGGDCSGTFNISTATAVVATAAGVRVVKHGNRAVSSHCGSADVLAELGVQVAADPALAGRCLAAAGMAFCLAPLYHPAMRHVAEVRRRLGRTMFNCLGPLANPAAAPYQLLGVGRPEWLERMAGALARLGTRQTFLVHARDGLDEVSLSAPTLVRRVRGGEITALEWTPADFGLEPCSADELRVSGAAQSAAVIRAVLAGQDGPARRVVLANTAAALLAAEVVATLQEGVARAARAIDDGRAEATLLALVEITSDGVAKGIP